MISPWMPGASAGRTADDLDGALSRRALISPPVIAVTPKSTSPEAMATDIGSDASKVTKSASSPSSANHLGRGNKSVGECEASGRMPI